MDWVSLVGLSWTRSNNTMGSRALSCLEYIQPYATTAWRRRCITRMVFPVHSPLSTVCLRHSPTSSHSYSYTPSPKPLLHPHPHPRHLTPPTQPTCPLLLPTQTSTCSMRPTKPTKSTSSHSTRKPSTPTRSKHPSSPGDRDSKSCTSTESAPCSRERRTTSRSPSICPCITASPLPHSLRRNIWHGTSVRLSGIMGVMRGIRSIGGRIVLTGISF